MNIIEVSKRLPLLKFEIYEDVDGAGHVAVSECHNAKDAGYNSQSFRTTHYKRLDTLQAAFAYAGTAYVTGKVDASDPSAKFRARHRIVIKESCRGRDGGSEWADPENDITKSGGISVDIFVNDEDREERHQHYGQSYAPHCPFFGVSSAFTTFIKLLESCYPSEKEVRDIVAFEWRDRVFTKPYVMRDQLCVSGTYTDYEASSDDDGRDGENDSEGRPTVKVDYFRDYVRFHKRNHIEGVGHRFWLDGKAIYTLEGLKKLFPDANEYGILNNGFYKAEDVLKHIRREHPEVTNLSQGGMGHMMNFGRR